MTQKSRRQFLQSATYVAGTAAAATLLLPSIRNALAIPAKIVTGTIHDVTHIVILMQENRSFDHYFGTLRGVRGFGDRHPIPLPSGKPVWFQSDGEMEIPPFHLDTKTTSAMRLPGTPHHFPDAQAAWNQGKFGFWPKFKTPYSMGYYERSDIPFQFALAEAFTICDAYYCSITGGTDPNRIMFWSGSNFNPELGARGENSTDTDSEPDDLRCWIEGTLPEPGYSYQGTSLQWTTIPEVLENAGIDWRIYQDPNDNWTGAMHGCLAFESFRKAPRGSAIHKKGMSHWSLEQFAEDVKNDRLPQVSWILPPRLRSEHPIPSSPLEGAEITAEILKALTVNPEVWSKTVFFQTFDENDGLFDHMPPPALPSYNLDGTLAGKSTIDPTGEYFSDPKRKYLDTADIITGSMRPWGLGPRVPMYVVSPWSKGGWVNSQVFDHTSVGQFLEKRFSLQIPAISPWHRAISGDLTSAFDFVNPNDAIFPRLPDASGAAAKVAEHSKKPKPTAPAITQQLVQEAGARLSRALPYELYVTARVMVATKISLVFRNAGTQGVVFHVYDKLHLDRIPRRYTVEANKTLLDTWDIGSNESSNYDLRVHGPNGFLREFRGSAATTNTAANPEIDVRYYPTDKRICIFVHNPGAGRCQLTTHANAYRGDGPWKLSVGPNESIKHSWSLVDSGNWYDFTVTADAGVYFERTLAGRMETGVHSVSDPEMGTLANTAPKNSL